MPCCHRDRPAPGKLPGSRAEDTICVAMSETRHDLTRTTLAVLFIGGLLLASFWIMQPFLAALIWAGMIVVSTWPLMRRAQGCLWGRRWLAVSVMMLGLLLVFIVRSEEHTSELQSQFHLLFPLLLFKN